MRDERTPKDVLGEAIAWCSLEKFVLFDIFFELNRGIKFLRE